MRPIYPPPCTVHYRLVRLARPTPMLEFLSRLRPGVAETPLDPPPEAVERALPILWLLGKTAAGKSSLIRALTGLDAVEIGNGFAPCTRTSRRFDHPATAPLLRFLDTRGLGEAGYDPAEDIAACAGHAHAILVLCRLDDPVQGEVAETLGKVMAAQKMPALLVHTGGDLLPDPEARERARAATAARIGKAVGHPLPEVEIALPPDAPPDPAQYDALIAHLLDLLPAAALLLARRDAHRGEQAAFDEVRNRVLFYAGLAGTTDIAPFVGAVSVPAAQMAMLRELGQHYRLSWSRELMAAFLGALGLGVAARFGASYGLRQLGKLVPVYGQTLGAAAAGSLSFAATYALGRAAGHFLYHRARGEAPDPEALRAAYRSALKRAHAKT